MAAQTPTLYELWRAEKRIWLEGADALGDITTEDSLINGPTPRLIQTGADVSAQTAIRPFSNIELTERHFVKYDNVVVISYVAVAEHPRYRGPYYALCQSTYIARQDDQGGGWSLIAHSHAKLKRNDLADR